MHRSSARARAGASLAAALLASCALQGGPPDAAGKPVLLVVGATGGTGQEIVAQALRQGYAVRALVRDVDKARTLFGGRIAYAVGDVREPRTLRAAMRGVDFVVSALGSNAQRDPENSAERVDYGGVRSLAEAAAAARVKHFVLTSSMGVTNPDHPLNATLDGLLGWKLKGEEALRASGVSYTIVRAARLNNDPGSELGIRVLQGDPRDVMGTIPRADVAAVLLAAVGREEAFGKTLEIMSDHERRPADWNRFFAGLAPDAG